MSTVTKPLANREGQDAIALAIQNIGAANIGNLSALTTITKTSLVAAINELNSKKADAESISPVEESDTASSAHSSGTYFYLDGKILKATEDIDEGDTIDSSNSQEIVLTEELENKSTVEASTTNGNIKIDNVETPVYRLKGNNTVLSTDRTPYLLREALSVTNASAYVREKLIGCSVAWNQLVVDGNFPTAGTYGWMASNATITTAQGLIKFTASAQNGYIVNQKNDGYVHGLDTSNHKVLISCKVKLTSATTGVLFSVWGNPILSGTLSVYTQATTSWQTLYLFVSTNSSTNWNISLLDTRSSGWDEIQAKDFQIHDLTLAFGSSVADTLYAMTNNGGIDWLRNHNYPIDQYTQYGYGLYSTKPSAKRVFGFNVFDEEMEIGSLGTSGQPTTSTTALRAKNHISILPSTTYYFRCGYTTGVGMNMYEYDANKEFIRRIFNGSPNQAFTTSANARYVRLNLSSEYGTTYRNDVCLNISDTNKNGTYEPYSCTTYSLGSTELRGHLIVQNGEIVAEGDVRESNGNVTRNYLPDFDLGSLNWQAFGSSYPNCFYAEVSGGIYFPLSAIGSDKGVTAKYTVVAKDITTIGDKECTFGSQNVFSNKGSIMLKDTTYSDAATLKTSLSGIYATCIRATPTTETSSPFADPMSLNGCTTEEYVDDRSIPVPVGHETQYMGQSEDVVEIPSMPLADGKRVLTSYKSGNKEQLVWEDDGLVDISSEFVFNTTSGSGNARLLYDPKRKIVFINMYYNASSSVAYNYTIGTISEKYRPSSTIFIYGGIYKDASDVIKFGNLNLYATGVLLNANSSWKGFSLNGWYKL